MVSSVAVTLGAALLVHAADPPAKESAKPAAESAAPGMGDMSTPEPQPIAEFVIKGVDWLVAAQHENGGWGAGTHANQQLRDPHKVQLDPATTAFAASALLRAGHTPTDGKYSKNVRRATEYLCGVVEEYTKDGPKITDLAGTQIQAKLGPLVDTAMTSQYLARVLPQIPESDKLHARVDAALDKCLKKLHEGQQKDGSWNVAGGWAPVLQSSLGCAALELAQAAGKKVDEKALDKARDYQKDNFDTKSGRVNAEKGAGVALYAFSGAQRANAAEARAADELIAKAKEEGKLEADAKPTADNLQKIGVAAPAASKLAAAGEAVAAQAKQVDNEGLLRGFGNNGGEEFLSFCLSSESLVIGGGDKWNDWNKKMHDRLGKAQSADGSWSGHHCITSPVFCTAAVVQCLTTDRDAKMLVELARKAAEQTGKVAERTAKKGS
jgi:hypothetical protein